MDQRAANRVHRHRGPGRHLPNWRATAVVDSSADNVPITIEVWDIDGPDPNDHVDVSYGDTGNDYDFDALLSLHDPNHDCLVRGDGLSGLCNQTLLTYGANEDHPERAQVRFRVAVEEAPQAPGLHIACRHTPMWPQPGQQVTITASTFGDQPDGQRMPAVLADRIELWTSADGGATRTIAASSGAQTTFTTNAIAGTAGGTLSYGCRAVDNAVPIFSGWKTVQVGDPPQGRAVPVLLAESVREHAIDIVVFPVTAQVRRAPFNANDTLPLANPLYGGPQDPAFLQHVSGALDALLREQTIVDNQRALNIWVARDGGGTGGSRDLYLDLAKTQPAPDTTGDGLPDGTGVRDVCQHEPPGNTGADYGWGDAKARYFIPVPACGTAPRTASSPPSPSEQRSSTS